MTRPDPGSGAGQPRDSRPWWERIGDLFAPFQQQPGGGDTMPQPGQPLPTGLPPRFPEPLGPQQPDQAPTALELPLTGRERLDSVLRSVSLKPGTKQHDEWLLSLRQDPADPAYNVELRAMQGSAMRRRELRKNPDLLKDKGWPRNQGQEPLTPEDFEQREKFLKEREGKRDQVVIGPDGEPLGEQFVVSPDGTLVPLETGDPLGVDAGVYSTEEAIQSGQYVWLGDMVSEESTRFGPQEKVSDNYMGAQDAMNLPYHWDAAQISYAQEALGLDVTGFADQQLIQRWGAIVASAAGYAQAGRRIDPFTLLDMSYDAAQAAARGRGGGGGGAGGPAYSQSQTKAFLNQVMLQEAGREATDEEAAAFHGAISGAGEVDPGQFAIDWIRSIAGEEAAGFQVATDYYEAMLQILGARTQAEGGEL